MYVGQEGVVYAVLPYHEAASKYSYFEADRVEGTIGFLYKDQKYHAVTFRGGEWKTSDPFEFIQYYQAQCAEWNDCGLTMSWTQRFAFLRLFVEIANTKPEGFNNFY